MEALNTVEELLMESGDPHNPPPAEIVALLEGVKKIAVVGMSRDPKKPARRIPSYLASKGYEIIPVNPFADRILGKVAVDCVDVLTEPVDMVLIFRPSADAAVVMEKAMELEEKPAIWLQEGIMAPEQAAKARAAGFTVVQDLCTYKVHMAYAGDREAPAASV